MKHLDLNYVLAQTIGRDLLFQTPFGERNMFYADYTASGRCLAFIEEKILNIQRSYANTHTEDDYSGKYLTQLLHAAERHIKTMVHALEHDKIIAVGSGTTGALKRLQEIIGVYIPPATRERLKESCPQLSSDKADRPVVFIGPYEHHTNELMWRESYADVEVIPLDRSGMIDLEMLDKRLSASEFKERIKFVSFSAGSNITGIRTRVYETARICHRNHTPVFFDFAAVAPYVEIDMNRDAESYFDAIFFSPHKFLGGPGSSGILLFKDHLYRDDLPPTAAGGGTVNYVGFDFYDFSPDIETRERAGTPPILQTIKAALAMEVKKHIGVAVIDKIENKLLNDFLKRIETIPNILLVGTYDKNIQTPIVSFNIKHKDRILHPKFVTKLLNDLFGIQSRAGCSCAGPYGHRLLGIDDDESRGFRLLVQKGYGGIKPGWIRINLHYTFSRSDVDFLLNAIDFVARRGHLFLRQYVFLFSTGEWRHKDFLEKEASFSLEETFKAPSVDLERLSEIREDYFREAELAADRLGKLEEPPYPVDSKNVETLKYFYYAHATKD